MNTIFRSPCLPAFSAHRHASFHHAFLGEGLPNDDVPGRRRDVVNVLYEFPQATRLVGASSQENKHDPEEPTEIFHHDSVRHPHYTLFIQNSLLRPYQRTISIRPTQRQIHIYETSSCPRRAPLRGAGRRPAHVALQPRASGTLSNAVRRTSKKRPHEGLEGTSRYMTAESADCHGTAPRNLSPRATRSVGHVH